MKVLVTGGAGYIGSHTVLELLNLGYEVIVLDSLVNSSIESIHRIQHLCGKSFTFVKGDIRDKTVLKHLFAEHSIDAVIHFAGLKAVGESVTNPLEYYDVNVNGALTLCSAMRKAGVFKLIFSSSATVYGEDAPVPYLESMPRGKTSNPYGSSKAIVEQILTDLQLSDSRWSVVLLRYFNPIGAHPSGQIGEDPQGTPNNLMPFIAQVAVGTREQLTVFGQDYPTDDGTCERDYLHVVDLAIGHVKALQVLNLSQIHIFNLGTGSPVSVLTMVKCFEEYTGVSVPYVFGPRRAGDLPAFWADTIKAEQELNWRAERSLKDMILDTWRWQSANPRGYRS